MAEKTSVGTKDTTLLERIRSNYAYGADEWRDIREEGKKDIRYLSGDPWEPKEKEERNDTGRPFLALDELNQYVNQVINDARQNKRAVKVLPKSVGSTDATAELRGNIIRQIEYKSNAQAAYITGFENGLQRSYGYWAIRPKYISDDSFDQELTICRIPNPDTVVMDPGIQEADGSDMNWCFELSFVPREEFKKRFPKAEIKDFTPDDIKPLGDNTQWVTDRDIMVAAYWEVEKKFDKLTEGDQSRTVEKRSVKQYLTNGVEILEEHDMPGKYIPIIPVFGKELYVDRGQGPKRMLFSLIRLARDAYKAFCYAVTCEAECIGKTPKMNYLGAVGQFDTNTDWANIHRVPAAYAEYKAKTAATGDEVLGPPAFTNYEPPIEALMQAAEQFKRSIQSATGMFNTSVGKHDTAAQSGVAVKALDSQSNQGSFHFIQNFERGIEHSGRVLDNLLDYYYDTPRDIAIRMQDDTHAVVRINDPEWVNPKTNQKEHLKLSDKPDTPGEHDVTITTGPSYESQREQANDFVDTIVQNIKNLPIPPDVATKILAIAIKLKDLGPLGDEMSELLSPDPNEQIPPQAQAAIQKAQQQIQQLNGYSQQLEAELQKLKFEKAAKTLDNEFDMEKTKENNRTKIAIAEIETKAQSQSERLEALLATSLENHKAAHQAGMQASDQAHAKDVQATDQAHQQDMQQSQQDAAQQSQGSDQEFQQQQAEAAQGEE